MKKLALTAFAASVAFIPNLAQAQHRPPPGADFPRHVVRHVAPNVMVRQHGPDVRVRQHGGNVVVRHDGGRARHPGRDFRHRRLRHGVVVHPFWFGPQFHIANWQMYGFAHPGADRRWIRYYDDAYMIDRSGRVLDARYGMDWDRYGERWADDDGIPAYYGRGDYHPGEEDYAWVEEQDRRAYADRGYDDDHHDGGWDYSEYDRGPGHGYPPMTACHPAPQPCGGYGGGGGHGYPAPMPGCHPAPHPCGGYGYQQSYGYGGYGYAWPAVIVETTVTTAGSVTYTEEVVEEVVRSRRAHRPRRAPVRRAPVRRPPPGERG